MRPRPGEVLPGAPARRARPGAAAPSPEARALARDLRRAISGEVLFDGGSRALYATDASNYRYLPIGVVRPRSIQDVLETVRICRRHGAPILSRGGGTSLAGQCTNVAVVIDWTRHLGGVLSIDPDARTARVLPGTVLDALRGRAVREHRLTFGPDPATHSHCTLGGMIGNNSCGVHAQWTGCTAANVVELDVLTADGARFRVGRTDDAALRRILAEGGRRAEIYRALLALRERYGDEVRRRYPRIPRRISGYNLDALLPEQGFDVARALVGSEGTLVTILEATVRLVPEPAHRALLVAGFEDVASVGDAVPAVLPLQPMGLEGLDDLLVEQVRTFSRILRERSLSPSGLHPEALRFLPEGRSFLMVEFGGETRDDAEGRARAALAALRRGGAHVLGFKVYSSREETEAMWKVREAGLGATARVPGGRDTFPGWEDSAVPPERTGDYLRALQGMFARYGYRASLYGHFGQGCVHCSIDFVLHTREGLARYRRFVTEAAELVTRMGGSLSGEHGDGQSRAELLPIMFGQELVRAFRAYKRIWDPEGLMNPGRIVGAPPLDDVASMRVGPAYQPRVPRTFFRYPDDEGHFFRATERCVGVGECRRDGGGTMCPSYMVTREEQHSTRGRAHLLHEMLRGELVGRRGWRDQAVKESLDLCLACKGCKGDCPVRVDMATYKAEFLAHYFQGRLRPRAAYSMGLVMAWARAASLAPGLVNFLGRTPPFSGLAKRLAGIAPQRRLPRFAPETFQRWAARRRRMGGAPAPRRRRRVLLWPDTFNNHFFPETARAALELLEGEGFEVEVPRQALCCGRPLYDFGMLPTAKWMLERTMRLLAPELDAGTPILVLEPSCASVFRDELRNLFPDDERARRLREQTVLFAELLERESVELPPLHRAALLQGHCHHKSLFRLDQEERLLKRLDVRAEIPEPGCCGMAGAFGFERGEKHRLSMKLGERALLPAARAAGPEALLVADGFSCREQLAQATGRRPLHVAEVAWMARHGAAVDPARALAIARPRRPARVALLAAAAGALVLGALRLRRKARR